MTFRTDYTGAMDPKLVEAKDAGVTFITTTNAAAITTGLTTNAAKGLKSFTIRLTVGYQSTDIRRGDDLWFAFQSGIWQALHDQDIMNNEVAVNLNTSDAATLYVDLVFAF